MASYNFLCPLLLTDLVLCCCRCLSATDLGGFDLHIFIAFTNMVDSHHLRFLPELKIFAPYFSSCQTAAHQKVSLLSLVSYCYPVGYFCIITCVHIPLSRLTCCPFRNTIRLSEVAQHLCQYSTATHYCGSALLHVSNYSSLLELCIISSFPLLLLLVVLYHFRGPTLTY